MPEETEEVGKFESQALNALRSMNPSKEIVDLYDKVAVEPVVEQVKTEENLDGQQQELENQNTVAETVVNTEQSNESVQTKEEEELIIESKIFGGGKINLAPKKETTQAEDLKFESVDDVQTYLKEKFEIEDIKSLGTVIEQAKKREEEFSEVSTKLTNAEKIFQTMNPKLYQAVIADLNGQEWEPLVTNSGIDYTKNVTDFEAKVLLENFFPGEVSNEDWAEYQDEDGDPKLKKSIDTLIKISKDKFTETKSSKETETQKMIENQVAVRKQLEESLDKSASIVSSKIEGIDQKFVQETVNRIKTEGVGSLFYDKNGAFREDAVLRFIMAEEGFDLVEKQRKALEKRIETRMNEEIISRGASTPSVQTGKNQQKAEVSTEAQREIERIRALQQRSTY